MARSLPGRGIKREAELRRWSGFGGEIFDFLVLKLADDWKFWCGAVTGRQGFNLWHDFCDSASRLSSVADCTSPADPISCFCLSFSEESLFTINSTSHSSFLYHSSSSPLQLNLILSPPCLLSSWKRRTMPEMPPSTRHCMENQVQQAAGLLP